jgi:hypothetical protein
VTVIEVEVQVFLIAEQLARTTDLDVTKSQCPLTFTSRDKLKLEFSSWEVGFSVRLP